MALQILIWYKFHKHRSFSTTSQVSDVQTTRCVIGRNKRPVKRSVVIAWYGAPL